MNFFKRKRKREEEDDLIEPKAKLDVLSWLKLKFNNLVKKNSGNNILSKKYGVTPEHLKVERYVLSPPVQVPVDQIRTNKDYYIKGSIVKTTENKFYEFKTAGGRYFKDVLPQHVRKYGSGFLNSQGGIILAGILDNGAVKGVKLNANEKKQILKTTDSEFQKFRPKVEKSLYSVEFRNVYEMSHDYYGYPLHLPIPNFYIVEITVKKGLEGEIYEDAYHKVYVRREASVEGPLSPVKIKELVLEDYKRIISLAEIEKERRKKRKLVNLEEDAEDKNIKRQKKNISPIKFDL